MTNSLFDHDLYHSECLASYSSLRDECYQFGLKEDEISKSKNLFTEATGINGRFFLKPLAYYPTGLALGCPLPSKQIIRQFEHITNSIINYFSESIFGNKVFSAVPKEYYHITVVNRTHFEASKKIFGLNNKEKNVVEHTLNEFKYNSITIHLNGLILTDSGRLIVPGFPTNESFYQLRYIVSNKIPALQTNIPKTAHVKLGHVLLKMKKSELETFLDFVATCGEQIKSSLTFKDIFTPIGRLLLTGGEK